MGPLLWVDFDAFTPAGECLLFVRIPDGWSRRACEFGSLTEPQGQRKSGPASGESWFGRTAQATKISGFRWGGDD
jgi:hypothetical protein